MDRFRRILSLPMFATALGLAWILGRLAGVDGMTLGLAAALLVAVALWWVGRRQASGRERQLVAARARRRRRARAARRHAARAGRPPPRPTAGALAAEPFSEARLAALQAEGRPVFVYFTADWCLTCKVNEKAAIERSRGRRRRSPPRRSPCWSATGRAATRRSAASSAAQGRSGVPLYLYLCATGRPPVTLPQVLTPGTLTALVS